MTQIETLVEKVKKSRNHFIDTAKGLSFEQETFKPDPDVWSVTENVEHIVWAERAGVIGMWKAVKGYKNNQLIWSGKAIHQNLTIEEIVSQTWQTKEKVPEIAKPRWGGPLSFWMASLSACQPVLEDLVKEFAGLDPEQIIYPHPISGPLNIIQRLEFLRFHLERHQKQMESLKIHPEFPNIPTS